MNRSMSKKPASPSSFESKIKTKIKVTKGGNSGLVSADQVSTMKQLQQQNIHGKGHQRIYQEIQQYEPINDNVAAKKLLDGLMGNVGPSDDFHCFSFHLLEARHLDTVRRLRLELTDASLEVCHVRVSLPNGRVPWENASFDFAAARPKVKDLKQIAANGAWAVVPAIETREEKAYVVYTLEGILFERGLAAVIDERIREPNFRLASADEPQPITVAVLGRDEKAISDAVRGMFCVMRTHIPADALGQVRSRFAHRLLQVRAMMPAKRLGVDRRAKRTPLAG